MHVSKARNTITGAFVVSAIASFPAPNAQAVPFAGFAPPVTSFTGASPYSVALGDLNNDGALDLAVTNYNGANVSIILGNGAGGFVASPAVTAGVNPMSVAMGDLNGDGALDLAVANKGSDTVSILLGDGTGGFAPQQTFPVGFMPSSVGIGDLNGDGAIDLAVADGGTNTVSILIGDGAGSFAPPQTYYSGSIPVSVALGDFDGDSALDLVVVNNVDNNVAIFINQTNVIAPGAFDLFSPADGSAGLSTPEAVMNWPGSANSAPVSWSTAAGSTTYNFTIATDAALTSVVLPQTGLTAPNSTVPTGVLQIGTRYYWGVTAVNAAGSTPSTSVYTLTTAAPADLNGDGVVSAADLATLLATWGVLP